MGPSDGAAKLITLRVALLTITAVWAVTFLVAREFEKQPSTYC